MKSWIFGAAMLGTMAISVPTFAATSNTAEVANTAQLEAKHPAMQHTLQYSDRGHWVMTLQADLNLLGSPSGPVDGVFGPKTEAGIKNFQAKHRLPVTGVADAVTWQDILAGFGLTPYVSGTAGVQQVSNQSATTQSAVTPASTQTSSGSTGSTIDGRPILHVYHMLATAYGPSLADNYPYGPTDAFGQPLQAGMVAVDPSVIPLKSYVYVKGYKDSYLPQGGFLGHAMDTGGAIKGMRVDIFMNDNPTIVSNFGVQPVTVYVLGN